MTDLNPQNDELDLRDEEAAWLQVGDQMAVLDSYYEEISRVGGVSRDQALVLVHEYGVNLGERYPPESFTDVPSKTNLAVTMEGLLTKVGEIGLALIKAAGDLLMKIIRWISAILTRFKLRLRDVARRVSNLAHTNQANRSLDELGIATIAVKAVNMAAVDQARNSLQDAQKQYEDEFNDLYADILSGGQFSRAVRAVGMMIPDIAKLIRNKFSLFDQAVNNRATGASAELIMLSEFRTIAIATPIQHMAAHLKAAGVSLDPTNGNPVDFAEAMRRLSDRQQFLVSSDEFAPPALSAVTDVLTTGDALAVAPFLLSSEQFADEMARIERNLQHIRAVQRELPVGPNQDIRRALNMAVERLTVEVQALRTYVGVVENCSSVQNSLIDHALRYAQALFLFNRARAGGSENEDLIAAVNEVQENLRKGLKK